MEEKEKISIEMTENDYDKFMEFMTSINILDITKEEVDENGN